MITNADLIQAYLKTRDAQAAAKAALDDEKAKLRPWEDNHNAARKEHAEVKNELTELLNDPGAKIETDSGSASLSNPKATITREVDLEALLEWAQQQHPRVVQRFTRDVAKTPAPRLTVKGK